MQSRSGFSGVYPMLFALFDAQGRLAREPMRRQVEAIVRHKAHGVAILGMATEVNKLSTAERRTILDWVAEDVAGAVPLAVTVAETSVPGQIEFVKAAAAAGAQWAILQPPPVKAVPETELIRFFGAVADASPIPVGIQNAPEYLGIGLSHDGILALHRAHPNVAIVKLEATALAIARLIERVEGTLDVFNGRDGIEMIDSIRAGAVGIIPGAEVFDVIVRIFDLMAENTTESLAAADRLYQRILPLLIVLMDSMDTFLVYGKRIIGSRLGIDAVAARAPCSQPSEFGLAAMRRYAAALDAL